MNKLNLKYGVNPYQGNASVSVNSGDLPFSVLNGTPSYINLLDALSGFALVKELKKATKKSAAASFKHVSPAGAAVSTFLTETEKKAFMADNLELSETALAYVRARGADRVSSYGDFVSISDTCDESLALFLKNEVSDGIIAPDYTEKALEILKTKKKGNYLIIKMDENYEPQEADSRTLFGITFTQDRNDKLIDKDLFSNFPTKLKTFSDEVATNLIISMIALKYTQSNSVALASNGGCIGIGAGQQSRIHCTRLACTKADKVLLRQSEKVLSLDFASNLPRPTKDNLIDSYILGDKDAINQASDCFNTMPEMMSESEREKILSQAKDVVLSSDAFFPFGDNVECAYKSGVRFIAQPGGSIRDDNVIETCDKLGITMAFTGTRLFTH